MVKIHLPVKEMQEVQIRSLGSERSPGGGNGKSTLVFLPGESHGQRRLMGCNPWGQEESDTAEHLSMCA